MSRNAFESNKGEPFLSETTLSELLNFEIDSVYAVIPPLEDGARYELITMSNGEVAVVKRDRVTRD